MFLRQTLKYAAVKAFQRGILYVLINTLYCWYRAVRLGYWEVNRGLSMQSPHRQSARVRTADSHRGRMAPLLTLTLTHTVKKGYRFFRPQPGCH